MMQGEILSLNSFLLVNAYPVKIDSARFQWVKSRGVGLHIVTMSPSAEATINRSYSESPEQQNPHAHKLALTPDPFVTRNMMDPIASPAIYHQGGTSFRSIEKQVRVLRLHIGTEQ